MAYKIAYGIDPGHLYVCHKCDNPRCCNPRHLFLGTALDNNLDKICKGRGSNGDHRGSKNGNAKLSEDDVRKAISLIMAGKTNVEIAGEIGIGHALVSRIRVGRSWVSLAHEIGYQPRPSKGAPKSGRTKPRSL
ncbi:MAG: HNH endonuclease [Pseudomonadota bacterium]